MMDILGILYFLPALLIAVTIHEFSHAYLADRLGDPTARLAGRVSLNPLAHLDLVGTLFLLIFHFGWGKPVPVNPRFFQRPVKDSALVSLAGPLSNFLLALLLGGLLNIMETGTAISNFLMMIFQVNLVLALFNLLPLPPLDGSKVVGFFVPRKYQYVYERFLETGVVYTIVFMLFDFMVMPSIFGFSMIQEVLGWALSFFTGVIFLQQ